MKVLDDMPRMKALFMQICPEALPDPEQRKTPAELEAREEPEAGAGAGHKQEQSRCQNKHV